MEADRDDSEDKDYSDKTELDLLEQKRQTAKTTSLTSSEAPSWLDLLLAWLNTEIETHTRLLCTIPHPSKFLPESPRKKQCIAHSKSPEEPSHASETSMEQELINGLQLGHDLDEILTH